MDSIRPASDPAPTGADAATESLCPVCLTRIPATRAPGDDGAVYQEKCCPVHGAFRTPIWRGHPPFHQWRRPKIPTRPPVVSMDAERGCPFDCGLCAEHRQRSCAVLIEVTRRCNLGCPICYADAGDIIRFAAQWSPTVRAVHFQPISYFGRYADENRPRLTLPELMQALEDQAGGMIRLSDFRPPGCENARCSFHANYIVSDDGGLGAIHRPYDGTCRPKPIPAETGADNAVAYVARQWSGRGNDGRRLPMADAGPGDRGRASGPMFLDRARTHTLSVSAMAFQDAWNLDLERVRDCCIHVLSPGGRLIPFCLYNLTDAQGRGLHRS